MVRLTALALLLLLGASPDAGAAVLDELFARGYTIADATVIPGSFTGCIRRHRVVLADGSVFACARTSAQTAYEPRVYILRLGGEPPSVVLAGSRVLDGELLRLRLHDYPVPLRMNADPLAAGTVVAPPTALSPVSPVTSINTVTQQRNAPLSQQQAQLPTPPRKNRSSR